MFGDMLNKTSFFIFNSNRPASGFSPIDYWYVYHLTDDVNWLCGWIYAVCIKSYVMIETWFCLRNVCLCICSMLDAVKERFASRVIWELGGFWIFFNHINQLLTFSFEKMSSVTGEFCFKMLQSMKYQLTQILSYWWLLSPHSKC